MSLVVLIELQVFYIIILGFGQVESRNDSSAGNNLQFRVAEVEREGSVDDRQLLVREAANYSGGGQLSSAATNKSSLTPFKSGSLNGSAAISHITPIKPNSMLTPSKNNR